MRRTLLGQALLALASLFLVSAPANGQEAEFQALSEQMRQKVLAAFDLDPTTLKGDASVLISRPLVARSISEIVNRSNVTIGVQVPESQSFVPPPQELRTETKADATIECSPDQFCNYGCDSKWPWEKLGCEADKAVCKAGQKLDCERRKSMAQLISDKKIATVSFKNVSVKGRASASGVRAAIKPALDSVTINAGINASIQMSVDGHLTPEPLIIAVTGCLPHDFMFRDEPVDMGDSNFSLHAALSISIEGGAAVVRVEPSKPTVTLRFAGTPALRFIARNPLAFLACSLPYTIAGISNLTHPNDTAKMDYELPIPSNSQTLAMLTAKVDGWELQVNPQVTAKAIGMIASVTSTNSKASLSASVGR
jgi:hypothetical protein